MLLLYLFTDKRLLLISALCLSLLVVASFLGSGISRASPSGILIEGSDALLGVSFIRSESLETATKNVNPTILIEYSDSILSLDLVPPVPLVQPSIGTPAVSPKKPSPVISPTIKPGEPYVHLYGHKMNVTLGEDVILYLSVVNPITSPGTLKVQLTTKVPSGWSITSAEFSPPAGGFQTATYDIKQGSGSKTIGISMLANQLFEGAITGYIDYYFVEQPESKYHKEVNEPVKAVQKEPLPSFPSRLSAPSIIPGLPEWVTWPWLIGIIISLIACIAGVWKLILMLRRRDKS